MFPLHADLSDGELKAVMKHALGKVQGGEKPLTVTISGLDKDPRELRDIPEVARFCKRLMEIGFPSILEVTTWNKAVPESYNPAALGAFEIWLLARGQMKPEMPKEQYITSFEDFCEGIPKLNHVCEKGCENLRVPTDEEIDQIALKGLFGNERPNGREPLSFSK